LTPEKKNNNRVKAATSFFIDWKGDSRWGDISALFLTSFHPQMVFLPNLGVNRRACLCDVVNYASAQALDFLDLGQKSPFLDWKHQKVPVSDKGLLWTGTN
jgi:hypothetical protein